MSSFTRSALALLVIFGAVSFAGIEVLSGTDLGIEVLSEVPSGGGTDYVLSSPNTPVGSYIETELGGVVIHVAPIDPSTGIVQTHLPENGTLVVRGPAGEFLSELVGAVDYD